MISHHFIAHSSRGFSYLKLLNFKSASQDFQLSMTKSPSEDDVQVQIIIPVMQLLRQIGLTWEEIFRYLKGCGVPRSLLLQ